MALSKGHEQSRLLAAQDSRLHRRMGVALHSQAAIGQDSDSIARIERLDRLPSGQPLRIQDPSTFLFQYLPGVDGPVSGGGG